MKPINLLPLLIAAFLLSSCGMNKPDDQKMTVSGETTKDQTNGGTTLSSDDKGVSLTIPKDWEAFNISVSAMKKNLQNSASKDPRIARFQGSTNQMAEKNRFKLMFRHKNWDGAYAPNGNVIAVPNSESLKEVVDANIKSLSQPGVSFDRKDVDLACGPATEVTYSVESINTKTMVDHFFFVVLKGGSAYFLSFGIPQADTADKAEVPNIAKTFQIN